MAVHRGEAHATARSRKRGNTYGPWFNTGLAPLRLGVKFFCRHDRRARSPERILVSNRIIPAWFPSREPFTQERENCIGTTLLTSFASVPRSELFTALAMSPNALAWYQTLLF